MKFFDTLATRIGYVSEAAVQGILSRVTRRNFEAGQISRLTKDMRSAESDISNAIRTGGATVRNKARDLTRNNDYVRGVLLQRGANIIGHKGFSLQMDCGEYDQVSWEWKADEIANRKIEAAWEDWMKPEHCSVHEMSFREIQQLLEKYETRDGEYFVYLVRNKNHKYGVKLQVLEPESIDERYNERLASGNIVRMGIEHNLYWVPVAFYMKKANLDAAVHGNMYSFASTDRVRIPAADIVFGFDRDHVTQARGISRLAWSMITIHMASEYEKASLVNARFSANKLAAIGARPGEMPEQFKGDGVEEETGAQTVDLEPGTLLDIGLNQLYTYDPKYPSEQHEPFMRQILRRFSVGQGLAYSSTSGDLSNANYGSNRVGMMSERELYKMEQEAFKEQFLNKVFKQWLAESLLKGIIKLPFNMEKFNRPVFVGRRWGWIDPSKDINAFETAEALGVATKTDQVAELGGDYEDILRKKQREGELEKKYGYVKPEPKAKPAVTETDPEDEVLPEDKKGRSLLQFARELLKNTNGHSKKEAVQ